MEGPSRVHLVTGFLGSGKTTLLRHVLEKGLGGERVAVLVNEFGEVGIDGAVLRRGGHEVVELASGCVCCEVGADMLDTVGMLVRDYSPDRIVFELSGVAEPGSVLSSLCGTNILLGRIRVEPVICVVDAGAFRELTAELEYGYYCQIQAADLVLVNKVDRISEGELPGILEAVAEHNPHALLLPCEQCRVDLPALFDAHPRLPEGHVHTHEDHHTHAGADFVSVVLRDDETVHDRVRVERWLEALPRGVFRVKGTLRCREGSLFLNWVRGGCQWEPAAPNDPPPTTLVCIGRNLDHAALAAALRTCVPQGRRAIRLTAPTPSPGSPQTFPAPD